MRYSDAIALAVVLMTHGSPEAAVAQASSPNPPPAALATIQMSGRGFEEGLQDGDRFQVRLFIWSLEGAAQSILGPDVSLFEPGCVARFGRGVQCAQLLVVGNAYVLRRSTPRRQTWSDTTHSARGGGVASLLRS